MPRVVERHGEPVSLAMTQSEVDKLKRLCRYASRILQSLFLCSSDDNKDEHLIPVKQVRAFARVVKDAEDALKAVDPSRLQTFARQGENFESTLRLVLFHDGDVLVQIDNPTIVPLPLRSVAFQSSTACGGRSPNVLLALRALAKAIEQDNQEFPYGG